MTNYVCVLGEGGDETIFEDIFSIRDNLSSKMISAPVESGREFFDNKVIMPREISIEGILPLGNNGERNEGDANKIVQDIKKMFRDHSYKTYTIVTKTDVVENMMCSGLEFLNSKDMFDAVNISISFKELIIANEAIRESIGSKKSTPANRDNNGTAQSGMKSAAIISSIALDFITTTRRLGTF